MQIALRDRSSPHSGTAGLLFFRRDRNSDGTGVIYTGGIRRGQVSAEYDIGQ